MVYYQARIHAIRARVAAQIELIKSLEAKIVKGRVSSLELARNQICDVDAELLKHFEHGDRTPAEEAWWLSFAERMLQSWVPYLKETEGQFEKFGGSGIEIVGGS